MPTSITCGYRTITGTTFRADYGTSNVYCGAPCINYTATSDTEYVVQRRGTSTFSIDRITGVGPASPTYTIGAAITRPGTTWGSV